MTEQQFMKKLRAAIVKLPKDEQVEILQDYEEYFAIGQLDGKSEEEIAKSLGSPKAIGKELAAAYQIERIETNATMGNLMRAIWTVIGLGFFNLIIVLAPFLTLASLLLSGWIASVGFIAAPLMLAVSVAVYPNTFSLFDLFSAIAFCGIGLFIAIGTFLLTKGFINLFTRYLKFNIRLSKGGVRHV